MKVLVKGDEKRQRWWIGAQLKCNFCERMVELEEDDVDSIYFTAGTNFVAVECVCFNQVVYKNPGHPKTLIQRTLR